MRRTLFVGWLLASALALFTLGFVLYPTSVVPRLLALAFWAIAVVPLSFLLWFRAARRREEADVDAALEAWHRGTPGSGRQLAVALQEAIDEEDDVSLKRLIHVLEAEPSAYGPFVTAANAWLHTQGGRGVRDEHLEMVRTLARPVLPVLSARP